MSEKRFLSPDTLAAPFGYSHVVDSPAGRIVYISGQVPLDSDGQLVGEGDFEAQARQVFENLTRALDSADASWDVRAAFPLGGFVPWNGRLLLRIRIVDQGGPRFFRRAGGKENCGGAEQQNR